MAFTREIKGTPSLQIEYTDDGCIAGEIYIQITNILSEEMARKVYLLLFLIKAYLFGLALAL